MQYRGKHYKQRISSHEALRGWVFFALYLVVFPLVMGIIQRSVGGEFPVAEASVIYYLLSATVVFLVFWNYLKNSFCHLLDHIPETLNAFFVSLIGAALFQYLVMLFPYPVENPNRYSYPTQFSLSPSATVAIVVVLIPLVEEVLFRGLLFGSLQPFGKPLAWAVSIVFYCVYCVWQFTFSYGSVDLRYLALMLQYLPAAVAFHWCFDKGGNIWASILLHMAINALSLFSVITRFTVL